MNNLGTNDETVIRTGAVIYEPDGKTPSVGAIVKVFKANSTDGQYVSKQTTDNNGKYALAGLPKGTYNIWAEKDSFVTFQDSVFLADNESTLRNDTLKCSSTLTGIVGIQPQHDPRTVTIQVVGTDKYFNNTDASGRFIMKGMAGGNYTLLLKSTLREYTPTTHDVMIKTCSDDTLYDTVSLIYTGIPVVTGMTSSYDTVNGAVHLQWNKTTYRNIQEYAIYRDFYDSINLSANPIAVVTDTFFADSIFKRSILSGTFSMTDPNDYHFKYRIAIRNNSGNYGETYKYVGVLAVSPTKVKPIFTFSTYHLSKNIYIDSSSINDSMRFAVQIVDPTRNLRSVSWADLNTGSIIRNVDLDTALKSTIDTCKYVWNTTGTKKLECTVVDDAGLMWKDTLQIYIVADKPVVQLTSSLVQVITMDTFSLHISATDRFGRIAKIEWDIGNKGVFSGGTAIDTVIVAPNLITNSFLCIVRVTDDDGNWSLDTSVLQIFGSMVDADGNVYRTMKIGTQEWMAENLRATKYNDGTPIPLDTSCVNWKDAITPKFCYYDNTTNTDFIKKYGALYNWYVVDPLNPNKVAPPGWHVPTDSEWSIMVNYLINNGYNWDESTSESKIAKSLAAKTDWVPNSYTGSIGCDLTMNNRSGFSALGAGYLMFYGAFNDCTFTGLNNYGFWWSATEVGANAWFVTLCGGGDSFDRYNANDQHCAYSVRLLRDN